MPQSRSHRRRQTDKTVASPSRLVAAMETKRGFGVIPGVGRRHSRLSCIACLHKQRLSFDENSVRLDTEITKMVRNTYPSISWKRIASRCTQKMTSIFERSRGVSESCAICELTYITSDYNLSEIFWINLRLYLYRSLSLPDRGDINIMWTLRGDVPHPF